MENQITVRGILTDKNWTPTKQSTITLNINCKADATLKALSIIDTYLKYFKLKHQ